MASNDEVQEKSLMSTPCSCSPKFDRPPPLKRRRTTSCDSLVDIFESRKKLNWSSSSKESLDTSSESNNLTGGFNDSPDFFKLSNSTTHTSWALIVQHETKDVRQQRKLVSTITDNIKPLMPLIVRMLLHDMNGHEKEAKKTFKDLKHFFRFMSESGMSYL